MKRRTENVKHRLNSFVEGQGVAVTLLAFLIFVVLCVRYYQKNNFSPRPSPAPVVIDVQGDVSRPGMYLLQGDAATFWDAVQAAGGLSTGDTKDTRQLLLHRTIATGELLRVTRMTDGSFAFTVEAMPARARLILGQKLDLNQASIEELSLVPHMRPEFAEKIVERRHSKPWSNLQELKEISGVGPKTIDKWENHLEIKVPD